MAAAVVSPHVLVFPLPIQSPVNSMLQLAELLCLAGIRVTFLNTQHIHRRLLHCTNVEAYFRELYPNFRFLAVPDGLPEDNPRSADQFLELMESVQAVVGPFLREMLGAAAGEQQVSCVIADGILHSAFDAATRNGVPVLFFETSSPSVLWSYFCLPKLIHAGELPFQDGNIDEFITNAPGMEGIMRYRDLPSFCRSTIDYNDPQVALVLKEIKNVPLAHGLILNTFQDLEAPVLAQILKICPNTYAVGPLHPHLKGRLTAEAGPQVQPINSNSIWEEDRSCISWLDQQPSRSVIYVSFGSLNVITKDHFLEIWHGLVNSGSRFLWVRRPGSVTGLDKELDEVSLELSEGTKERGYIVSWAPQKEVLVHPSVGGFLTHSGWNSTLESITEGIPMICWPRYVDQHVNSRYVEEVWKVGLDMKDSCNRVTVEKMIRELMELKKDEFLQMAEKMAKLAKSSVIKGGSSFAFGSSDSRY